MINDFDYVIIGGGTAGCHLAKRLSTIADVGSIALVEAGVAAGDVRCVVPQWYPRLFGSRYDWSYVTEPVPGLQQRRLPWPRGKLLGGSGAINALIYLQASRGDFARWGWEWAEPLVERSLLHHASPPALHPWSDAFLSACQQQGLSVTQDFTRAAAATAGAFAITQRAGRRVHSGHPLLDDAQRPQLTVITQQIARRIVLERGRAVAVELGNVAGQAQTLYARREVIICCGAVGTPQLLMQSGIGPAAALHKVGVTCQVDAAGVGENLQDHLAFPLVFTTRAADGLRGCSTKQHRSDYRQHGGGPLTSNIAEAGCLFSLEDGSPGAKVGASRNNSLHASGEQPAIDGQVHFTPTHYLKFPRGARPAGTHCTLAVTDLHPHSLGSIEPIRSGAGGEIGVAIQPNYLAGERDVQRMLAAIRYARELAWRPALQAIIAREQLPGAKRETDRELKRALQAYSLSIYHPVGTCRMQTDAAHPTPAVVDSQFRVLGVDGLRIADASVLPDLPSCNTNAVTLLVAERLADLLGSSRC